MSVIIRVFDTTYMLAIFEKLLTHTEIKFLGVRLAITHHMFVNINVLALIQCHNTHGRLSLPHIKINSTSLLHYLQP